MLHTAIVGALCNRAQRPWRILADARVQARGLTSERRRWLSTTRYALQAVELMLVRPTKVHLSLERSRA